MYQRFCIGVRYNEPRKSFTVLYPSFIIEGSLIVIFIGGSKVGRQGRPPGFKFFHFHAVFGKNLKIIAILGVGVPPWGNPGSATDIY